MLRTNKNKIFVGMVLFAILMTGVAATTAEGPKPNLKVLPKNIDHEELVKIMKGFNVSLGVKCNFCHVPSKTDPKKLDFQSDEKPEKDIARSMMKMTAKINKKYFKSESGASSAITCITCHNGKEHPASKIDIPE
ncbi:MAG: c-type cytochrome [Chitinophagaceae bacterium]|nr:c-type cytochrome [Chitinophagaceae bacterium]